VHSQHVLPFTTVLCSPTNLGGVQTLTPISKSRQRRARSTWIDIRARLTWHDYSTYRSTQNCRILTTPR
jgi:hypothetical protein